MVERLKFEGKWQRWVAFGFGSGLSPVAPGTAGTLIGIPVVIIFQFLPTVIVLLSTLLIVLVSVWLAGLVTRQIGIEDHPSIVIDEIAGYVLAMTMIGQMATTPGIWLVGESGVPAEYRSGGYLHRWTD